jgi:hypothetical protein
MHHVWKLDPSITQTVTGHKGKIKNTHTSVDADIEIPKEKFFSDGSILDAQGAKDVLEAIEALLNMTNKNP